MFGFKPLHGVFWALYFINVGSFSRQSCSNVLFGITPAPPTPSKTHSEALLHSDSFSSVLTWIYTTLDVIVLMSSMSEECVVLLMHDDEFWWTWEGSRDKVTGG